MKLAVVCANGKAGSLIVKEAIKRGMDVTAFARKDNKTEAKKFVKKDLFEMKKEDLAGFDAVVDAFGAWTADTVNEIPKAAEYLCDLLSGSDARLLVVGGAGSLYVNPEHTACVADAPDFPDVFKPVAAAHDAALKMLRKCDDVNWTYISPAADFRADGEKTGKYILAGEEFTLNEKGESVISYADYAVATVDEAEKGNHIKQRISFLQA